jgi:hypothetical protein
MERQPSHQQNLDAVRAAAVRANPAIETDSSVGLSTLSHAGPGGYVVEHPTEAIVRGRPITAADVLLALEAAHPDRWFAVDSLGETVEIPTGKNHATALITRHATLDLRATLSSWDEASVAALANLLKKDD